MFSKSLTNAGHTRRFVVRHLGAEGWEVSEEQDSEIVRKVFYSDWHRVERAVATFAKRVSTLRQNGWVEAN